MITNLIQHITNLDNRDMIYLTERAEFLVIHLSLNYAPSIAILDDNEYRRFFNIENGWDNVEEVIRIAESMVSGESRMIEDAPIPSILG